MSTTMSDHQELIGRFTSLTGADTQRAQFYLESAAWNLDMAVASFFDAGDQDDSMAPSVEHPSDDPPAHAKPAGSRFATLDSMRHLEESDSEEEGQAFYAGGSERGAGQQVLGPPKKKNPNKLVQEMFEAAKEHGAETVEAGSSAPVKPRTGAMGFKGTAYRLGQTADDSVKIEGAPFASAPAQVDMVLKLWQNGFSVDDGPLRSYQDPQNQEFLSAIKRGEVPKELIKLAKGGEVNLNMEDHRNEDFVAPKIKVRPFAGEGHRLGSPADPLVVQPSASQAAPKSDEGAARSVVSVNENEPTTNLQIRLADGTRLVGKFNHTHTVADVRSYVVAYLSTVRKCNIRPDDHLP